MNLKLRRKKKFKQGNRVFREQWKFKKSPLVALGLLAKMTSLNLAIVNLFI